jgi:hypothetical protein
LIASIAVEHIGLDAGDVGASTSLRKPALACASITPPPQL